MNSIIIAFLIINSLAFIFFGIDKYKAIRNSHRISEKTLHSFSVFGGIVGSIMAMFFFRHKIKKLKFVLTQIFILIFWIMIVYLTLNK